MTLFLLVFVVSSSTHPYLWLVYHKLLQSIAFNLSPANRFKSFAWRKTNDCVVFFTSVLFQSLLIVFYCFHCNITVARYRIGETCVLFSTFFHADSFVIIVSVCLYLAPKPKGESTGQTSGSELEHDNAKDVTDRPGQSAPAAVIDELPPHIEYDPDPVIIENDQPVSSKPTKKAKVIQKYISI